MRIGAVRQSPVSCFSFIFLAVSASATVFPLFSIASGRAQRAQGPRAGPTQRPHNAPQNATHNIYTTSYTTSAQRLHNVRTTFQGLIPKESEGFEDQGRMPGSRDLLFQHISGRFCLCEPFPSLFHCFWARPAGAGPASRPYTTSAQRPPKSHTQRLHNVTHNVYTTSTQRSRG